ncbi:hypothetical protein [Pseudarthrobacter sp. SORGH_AS 212]|uniref:hypothetical protein n=1 Tax=Pseudarthrobacter sp. SORGH_AS 212 TaxID=3041777 RepID=UPI0032B85CAC
MPAKSAGLAPSTQASMEPAEVADTAVTTAASIAESDCASRAAPSMAFGFRRIAWKEPSRISPNISGRSGTMPGFGGAT